MLLREKKLYEKSIKIIFFTSMCRKTNRRKTKTSCDNKKYHLTTSAMFRLQTESQKCWYESKNVVKAYPSLWNIDFQFCKKNYCYTYNKDFLSFLNKNIFPFLLHKLNIELTRVCVVLDGKFITNSGKDVSKNLKFV